MKEQNRIFNRYIMIKQKIAGCLIALVAMGLWVWLTVYDVKLIWIGAELFPAMCLGCWMMLTHKCLKREIEKYNE